MRVPGLKRLRRSAQLGKAWVKGRLVSKALILAYHRVAEVESDPYSLCVTPRHFAEQLAILRQYANPVSLQDLLHGFVDGKLPKRSVALTFDDGYSDNLYNAKPLLEKHQIPATVFVTSGFLGREFWWDELNRALPPDEQLQRPFLLKANGHVYRWAPDRAVGRLRSAVGLDTRRYLLRSLHRFLGTVAEETRQDLMEQLWRWAGPNSNTSSSQLALTPAEVVRLASGQLIEIGAHTVTHPFLADISEFAQRSEIQQSKSHLEQILGKPVFSLSYPNGSTSRSIAGIVRQAGFNCACASTTDVAWKESNPFQLPRFWIPNWDGSRFFDWLQRWCCGH